MQLARERILGAVADHLAVEEIGEISVPTIARDAGVSLRTVYRYYPSRDELFAAAAEWIAEHRLGGEEFAGFARHADDLGPIFRKACERFDEQPNLVRALALTQAGRSVRWHRRTQRLDAIRHALAEVTDHLSKREVRQAEAVVFYLQNVLAWVTMRDEAGLTGKEAGEAVAWAIRTLVDDLRRRNDAAGAKGGGRPRNGS